MTNKAEYRVPTVCERCGSENIAIRAIFDSQIVRYICCDCGNGRSLPKEENLKKRTNTTLNNWALQVKKRQPFCVICGSKEGLEAHHIIPVSHSKRYEYIDTNGISLCKKCHYLVHNKESERR